MSPGAPLFAILAAVLFGASTPCIKALLGALPATLLAALLYLGSGLGLWAVRLARGRGLRGTGLSSRDWRWFALATLFGGVLGPLLLVSGLQRTSAASASLLLNLEFVLTALLAWLVFRENAGARVVLGMGLIVCGGLVLSLPAGGLGGASVPGALAVVAACACWAIDNNCTRKIAGAEPSVIAGTKGLIAGSTNLAVALSLSPGHLAPAAIGQALMVGFLGYGVSLVLFVLALRGLGAARTGAYFSLAPFIGAALSAGLLHEPLSATFWFAAMLMGGGVWLHLTERHEHEHAHEPMTHTHPHRHDLHHQHGHDFAWDGREPHVHEHRHEPLRHSHAHYPDLHHQHEH